MCFSMAPTVMSGVEKHVILSGGWPEKNLTAIAKEKMFQQRPVISVTFRNYHHALPGAVDENVQEK